MDRFRRKEPKFDTTRISGTEVLVMSDALYTHCPPGLFEASFDSANVETRVSRKTGTEYQRLVVRFRLGCGPIHYEDGAWQIAGNAHRGRLVALWQSLDANVNGAPALSPNAWFAAAVQGAPGNNMADKFKAWGKGIKTVIVRRRPGRPAVVIGYGSKGFDKGYGWTPAEVEECL